MPGTPSTFHRWLGMVAVASGLAMPDGASASGGIALDRVPIPHQVHSRSAPLKNGKTALAEFDTAPFPYTGPVPLSSRPFLETAMDGRRYRRTGRGQVLWENETFSDRRVLLHLPPGFDARRPGLMIVFLHGHGATLGDDVFARQKVPAQLAGANAVLVAPQFAVRASDSSSGKFWQPGAFARFVGEAAGQLARLHGDSKTVRSFASMPVVIVAYSGGYAPAAWSVHHGGLGKRLRGVVLFDALYGEVDKFANWIAADSTRLFVSAYTSSTRRGNDALRAKLTERQVTFATSASIKSSAAKVVFVPSGSGSLHRDFVTFAWADYPLADILERLDGYARR